MKQPRIGLTTWLRNFDGDPFEASPNKVTVDHNYVAAVLAAGGLPILLPNLTAPDQVAQLVGAHDDASGGLLDGLILTGGGDLDPQGYGQGLDGSDGIDPARDTFETQLVRQAHQRGIPVLGICRGIQVINVAFGGTLRQHVTGLGSTSHPSVVDIPRDEMLARRHDVRLLEGSVLAEVYGCGEVAVNSLHHQAVDTVADDFVITGTAADGIVEAMELRDGSRGIVAVQWHPEKMRADGGAKLFEWFVQSVRQQV